MAPIPFLASEVVPIRPHVAATGSSHARTLCRENDDSRACQCDICEPHQNGVFDVLVQRVKAIEAIGKTSSLYV